MPVAYIPNFITCLRIAGALCLFGITPLSTSFYVIYSLCGVSDAVDGYVARATNSSSTLGARLDSVADLMFYAAMLYCIVPLLWVTMPMWIWCYAASGVILRIGSYITAAVKFRCFASVHTYLNKLTGAFVFLLPYLMRSRFALAYCTAACTVGFIASAEEFIMHVTSPVYKPDRKTLISRK